MVVKISENKSWEGWNFLKLIKGNWKMIKESIKVMVPFFLGLQFFAGNPAMLGTITILGKGVLDSLEFYFKEVKLQN